MPNGAGHWNLDLLLVELCDREHTSQSVGIQRSSIQMRDQNSCFGTSAPHLGLGAGITYAVGLD